MDKPQGARILSMARRFQELGIKEIGLNSLVSRNIQHSGSHYSRLETVSGNRIVSVRTVSKTGFNHTNSREPILRKENT